MILYKYQLCTREEYNGYLSMHPLSSQKNTLHIGVSYLLYNGTGHFDPVNMYSFCSK